MRWLVGLTKEDQKEALVNSGPGTISLKRVLTLESGRALIYLAFLLGTTICIQAVRCRSIDGSLAAAFSVVVPTVGAMAIATYRKPEAPGSLPVTPTPVVAKPIVPVTPVATVAPAVKAVVPAPVVAEEGSAKAMDEDEEVS